MPNASWIFSQSSKPNELIFQHNVLRLCVIKEPIRIVDPGPSLRMRWHVTSPWRHQLMRSRHFPVRHKPLNRWVSEIFSIKQQPRGMRASYWQLPLQHVSVVYQEEDVEDVKNPFEEEDSTAMVVSATDVDWTDHTTVATTTHHLSQLTHTEQHLTLVQ